MKRQKQALNKLNTEAIQKLKQEVEQNFPWTSVKKAFILNDPEPLQVTNSETFKQSVVSAAVELGAEDTLRIYRKADRKDDPDHKYDVDEIRGVTASTVTHTAKSDIENHHLRREITDDLMSRNNMTLVAEPDGKGGLRIPVNAKGLATAYVNFTDARPEAPEAAEQKLQRPIGPGSSS